MSKWIRKSTPVPNVVLDQVLPKLRDTELRVLLVIVRATLGWVDPLTGGRKEREWLSSRQLRVKTGRESAAISQALDCLAKAQLILITDRNGQTVDTPAKRRRLRSKLCFRLHPHLLF